MTLVVVVVVKGGVLHLCRYSVGVFNIPKRLGYFNPYKPIKRRKLFDLGSFFNDATGV